MRSIKLFTLTIAIALFIVGCNSTQTDEVATLQTSPNDAPETVDIADNDYYAPENFDLKAVGDIFRESDSAEDFERRLNSDDGVNNLDLNGDGYVDYISVNEYEDRDTGYRGFSLLDNFGGDAIQEIATIILDRTLNDGRDSRFYINGNDQIYGNDNVYRADWKDTTLDIVNWAFNNDRNDYYQSPYYYDNYPDYYETYQVIETPVYRTRVQNNYYDPIFVKTDYREVEQIKIKSKYKDKYYDKIYAKLANPNAAQKEFRKNYPNRPDFVPNNRQKVKNVPPGLEKKIKDDRKDDKKAEKEYRKNNGSFDDKSFKDERKNDDRKEMKGNKPDKPQKNKMENKGRGNDGDKGNGKMKGGNGGGKAKGNGGGNGKGGGKGGGKGKN